MRTDLLAADVEELIREAQGEARAAVKARLRARFEDALTEAVEARLAPEAGAEAGAAVGEESGAGPAGSAPADTGDGLWLYCVTASGAAPDEGGVAAGSTPRTVSAAGLTAVVSTVPLADFGEAGLKRNLNDLPWLERVARAHENVLERTLEDAPIVPMRLCTIYRSEEQVQALLAERRDELTDALAALDGRGEWGVKVTADRERVADRLRARVDQRPAGVGGSYLGRKQQELRLRDEVDAALDVAIQESHARLEEWAVASELLPPQRAELSGHSGEMVLNGAYLIDDERLDGFRTVVEELGRQYGDDPGLAFELTGPWPPYNFVGGAT
jgi:Gas vesicle synthesis protein GvpL/GvpF